MSETSPLTDIFTSITTADDAYTVMNQINTMTAKLYQAREKSVDQIIHDVFGEDRAKTILMMLEKRQIPLTETTALRDFFTELNKTVESAKLMQVTLAVEPDSQLIQILASWGREKFAGENILVDWQQDPAILGGVVIIYEGQYMDFSLKKQVDRWFQDKKVSDVSEVPQVSNAS